MCECFAHVLACATYRLNGTLGTGEDSANKTKVLCTTVSALAHVCELNLHLLLERQVTNRRDLTSTYRCVVSHLN